MSSIMRALELATETGLNVVTIDDEAFVCDVNMSARQCLDLVYCIEDMPVRSSILVTLRQAIMNQAHASLSVSASWEAYENLTEEIVREWNIMCRHMKDWHRNRDMTAFEETDTDYEEIDYGYIVRKATENAKGDKNADI